MPENMMIENASRKKFKKALDRNKNFYLFLNTKLSQNLLDTKKNIIKLISASE
jgi:hypothetical protein